MLVNRYTIGGKTICRHRIICVFIPGSVVDKIRSAGRKHSILCIILGIAYGIYCFLSILVFPSLSLGQRVWKPFSLFHHILINGTKYELYFTYANDIGTIISNLYCTPIFALHEILCILFSTFVSDILHVISFIPEQDDDNNQQDQDQAQEQQEIESLKHLQNFQLNNETRIIMLNINSIFEKSVIEYYNKLKLLVEQFSSLFGWIIFFGKGLVIFKICFCVFCFITTGSHIIVIITVIELCCTSFILISLGSVFDKCVKFKESWVEMVSYLSRVNQIRLSLIQPFGFKCGIFYDIYPSTVLTYFSILATYTIIALQIFHVTR